MKNKNNEYIITQSYTDSIKFNFQNFLEKQGEEGRGREREQHTRYLNRLVQFTTPVSSFSVVCRQARQARKIQIHVGEIN